MILALSKFDGALEAVALTDLEAHVAEKLIEQYKDKLSHADRQVFDGPVGGVIKGR